MSKLPIGGIVVSRDPGVITPEDAEEILETLRKTEFTQGVRIENGDLVRVMAKGMTEKENERHNQIKKQWQNENRRKAAGTQ